MGARAEFDSSVGPTYDPHVHVDPWAFGWDALVAFGTLSLAGVTFFLAWSTRRLAVETATEVQAQWRPILVPVEDSIQIFEKDLSDLERERIPDPDVDTRERIRRRLEMKIRNIGRGPALEIMVSHLWEAARPWTASSTDAGVIPPESEWLLKHQGFSDERARDIRLQYRDLAGRRYVTEVRAFKLYDEAETINVKVSVGEPYVDPEIPRPPMADPLMARLPETRGRLRAAGEVLFPPVHIQAIRPFWRRMAAALTAMRTRSSATFSQRLRYGIGRGWGEVHSREVPWHLPRRLGGMFLLWRRVKRSYRAFRLYRGVGIPPVGYRGRSR